MDCWLLSPQDMFEQYKKQEGGIGKFVLTYKQCFLELLNQGPVSLPFDLVTNLPYLHCSKSVDKTALTLTMKGYITLEHNQNLSYLQKALLQ